MGLEKPVISGGGANSPVTGTFNGGNLTSVTIDGISDKKNIMFSLIANGTVSGGVRSGVLNTENNSVIYYSSSTSNCHEKDLLTLSNGVLTLSKYLFMNDTYSFVAW